MQHIQSGSTLAALAAPMLGVSFCAANKINIVCAKSPAPKRPTATRNLRKRYGNARKLSPKLMCGTGARAFSFTTNAISTVAITPGMSVNANNVG